MLQRPSQLDEDATRLAKVYRVVPAAHAAGAVLEYLAHTEDEQGQDLVLVNGHLALQDIAVPDSLPERWRDTPYRDDVRAFGDEWIRSAQAVQLPSVRYEAAFNLLINPDHPRMGRLELVQVQPSPWTSARFSQVRPTPARDLSGISATTGDTVMPHRSQTGTPRARGFAAMDANKQREIASMGGRAAHRSGNAHEFDAEEAREAGRRGGLARSASRRASRSIELADGQGVMMPGTESQTRADTMSRSSESMERSSDTGTLPH